MENLTLRAKKRTVLGRQNKRLREQGFIPAVVYGKKTDSCSLQVNSQDFKEVYKKAGDTDIIDLVIEDEGKEQTKSVLVQDVSNHFLNGLPIHIDFYEVEMDKPITTNVPISFIGESPAVKLGGILVKPMSEIEIEALPRDIPHEIFVDISMLTDFGQKLCARDINLPPKVKVLIDENVTIATVDAPITDEELEKELGTAKTVEEIEVEGEKKEEEGKEGEGEPKEQKEQEEEKEGVSEQDKSPKNK